MANDTGRGLPAYSVGVPPITRGLAITLIVALLVLVLLRHLFGSVRVEVGTK